MRQRRLADAGQIFDQQMTFGEQAAQGQAGLPALAENYLVGGSKNFVERGLSGDRSHGLSWWRNCDDNKPSSDNLISRRSRRPWRPLIAVERR
jgi:hypothetical protein